MLCPMCRGRAGRDTCKICHGFGFVPSAEQIEKKRKLQETLDLYSYVPHQWWNWNGLDCCRVCGTVQRKDGGKDSSCKGPRPLRVRKI